MSKRKRRSISRKPLTDALNNKSPLRQEVKVGLQACEKAHRHSISDPCKRLIDESLNYDEAAKEGREGIHRWDYLLGLNDHRIFGLEIHTATAKEVKEVIKKKEETRSHLSRHLLDGVSISKWYWVPSGKNRISPTSSEFRKLSKAGIFLVKQLDG